MAVFWRFCGGAFASSGPSGMLPARRSEIRSSLKYEATSCSVPLRAPGNMVPALVFGSGHAEPQPLNSNLGACTFVQPAPDAGIHDYRHCLRDRRIFVGGNSIARNLASAMAKLLSSDSAASLVARTGTARDEEKARCGRGTFGRADDPAACVFNVGRNTTITFGWEWRVYSEALWLGIAQLQPHLMLLHAGSDDIFDSRRRHGWQDTQGIQAALLARALSNFTTGAAYWQTSTRLCNSSFGHSAQRINSALQASNLLVLSHLCGQHGATVPVRVVDSFAWTWDRCEAYDDHIHHSQLAYDHVSSILHDYCAPELN